MITTVLPASVLAGASLPGRGITKRCFSPGRPATRAEDADADASARALEAGAPDEVGAPAGAAEAAAACAGGGMPLRLTRAAHALLRMQWSVKADACSSDSSPTPLSRTLDIERRAAVNRVASAHLSGSASPSQTLDGTRQHSRRTHRPYEPVSASSEPTRRCPTGMSSSAPHVLALPLAEHLERPDLAGSTRYMGTGSSAAFA